MTIIIRRTVEMNGQRIETEIHAEVPDSYSPDGLAMALKEVIEQNRP